MANVKSIITNLNGNVIINNESDNGARLQVTGNGTISGDWNASGYVTANGEGLGTSLRVGGIYGDLGLYVPSTYDMQFDLGWDGSFKFTRANIDRFRIDSSGVLYNNSGYLAYGDGTFTYLYAPDANGGITMGDATAPVNVYYNDTHTFQSAGQLANYGGFTSTGFGVGTVAPSSKLEVVKQGNASGGTMLLSGSKTNNAVKYGIIATSQYASDTETEGVGLIGGVNTSGENIVVVGGGIDEINTATSIRFFTAANTTTRGSANERMRINGSGNVGIGTTSPITKLSLGGYNGSRLPYIDGTGYIFNAAGITVPSSNNGNAAIGGGIDLTNNTYSVGAYSPIISFSSLSSNSAYNNSYAGIWGILGGQGGDANWVTGHIAFGTSGSYGISEKMRLTGNGNLLIGTSTDAGYKVDVNGTLRATTGIFTIGAGYPLQVYQTAATNSTTAIIRQTTSGGNGNNDIGLLVDIQGAADNDRIVNFRYYDGTNYNSRFVVQRGGNVNIGTTNGLTTSTYAGKLSIYTSSGANIVAGGGTNTDDAIVSRLISANTNNGNSGNEGANEFYGVTSIESAITTTDSNAGGDSGGYIMFKTKPEAGALTERMRINSYGQLLINATSSDYPTFGYNLGVRGTNSQTYIAISRANQTLASQGMIVGLDTVDGYVLLRDNINLKFGVNNGVNMTIAAGTGNVLIGTTTDSGYKLNVNGTGYFASDLTINANLNLTANNSYLNINRASNSSDGLLVYRTGGNNKWLLGAWGNSNETFYLYSYGVGTAVLSVDYTTGNLGIGLGTGSASAPLSVKAQASGALGINILGRDSDSYGLLTFKNSDGSSTFAEVGGNTSTGFLVNNYQNTHTAFSTNSTEKMRITSAGNVGIGTTAPTADAKVHIVGQGTYYGLQIDSSLVNTGGSDNLFLRNTSSGNYVSIGLSANDSDGQHHRAVLKAKKDPVNAGTAAGIFQIDVRNTSSNYTTALTVNALANVGIGTTSPGAYKLNVSGTGYYSGQLTVDGFANDSGISFRDGFDPTNVGIRAKAVGTANRDGLELLGYNGIDFTVNNGANVAMRIVGVTGSGIGNVGIGTTAPDSLTHIVGNTAGDGGTFNGSGSILHVKQNTGWSGNQPWALFVEGYSYLNGFRINAADGIRALYKTAAGGQLGFATAGNDPITFAQNAGDYRLYIAAGGNVLIGTTTDAGYKLYVNGTGYFNGVLRASVSNTFPIRAINPTQDICRISFQDSTNSSNDAVWVGSNGFDLALGAGYEERMRINSSGFAGIATFPSTDWTLSLGELPGGLGSLDTTSSIRISYGALGVGVNPSATIGRIDASNDIVAYSTSDSRLKENITPIANALDKVKSLTGVEFDWKQDTKDVHGYEGHDVGVIAQEVQAVLPEAIRTNDTGYLSVRYEKMIALLIEANKELAARVEELEKKLK